MLVACTMRKIHFQIFLFSLSECISAINFGANMYALAPSIKKCLRVHFLTLKSQPGTVTRDLHRSIHNQKTQWAEKEMQLCRASREDKCHSFYNTKTQSDKKHYVCSLCKTL